MSEGFAVRAASGAGGSGNASGRSTRTPLKTGDEPREHTRRGPAGRAGRRPGDAAKLASEAEEMATEAERAAIAGNLPPAKATEAREAARFARLRHALTERRAERYAAALRLQELARVGEDAVRLAGRLKALRDATLADLARSSSC
jgi:hypothetical protein